MMSEIRWCRRAVATALATALGTSGIGATAQADEERVEVITVTAQKQEENVQDVQVSVKALSSETLNMINADGLEDVVRLVPSACKSR